MKAGIVTTAILSIGSVYIPIWIDLKGKSWNEIERICKCLHSNMDRFESLFTIQRFADIVRLHSNMDRFERNRENWYYMPKIRLHSNMDRFESAQKANFLYGIS